MDRVDEWYSDRDDESWSVDDQGRTRCDWCGERWMNCTCDDALFDADELGLDPEDDDGRH